MGYRQYLQCISKKKGDKIRTLTVDELKKKYGEYDGEGYYVSPHDIPTKELYEFGKYWGGDGKEYKRCFFLNMDTHKYMTREYDFWMVDDEFVKVQIEFIHKEMGDYLQEIFDALITGLENKDFDAISKSNLYGFINNRLKCNWKSDYGFTPYNLDKKSEHLVKSDAYEYQVFDLVRIYKTFDFDKNYLLFTGW